MKIKDKYLALIAIFVIIIIGGGTGVLTKIAEKEVSPPLFTLLRFIISLIFLLPLFLKERIKIDKNLIKLIFISLLASGNVILFAYGIKLTTANIGSTLYVFGPVLVAIFSYFILQENLNVRKIGGVLIGFFGAILIVLLPLIQNGSPFSGNLLGNSLIMIAVISFSIYSVLSKKLQNDFSPNQITTIFSLTTFVLMLLLTFNQVKNVQSQLHNLTPPAIFSILYVGILSTAVFYFLYQFAIKHGSPVLASTVLYLQPVSTFVWAFIVLGEKLTLGLIIGGLTVLSGTLLIATSRNNVAKIDKQ